MSDKFVRLLKEYHSLAHVQHPSFKDDMEASTFANVIPPYLGLSRENEIMELVKKLEKEDKNWHLIWELETLTNQHLPGHANNTAGKYELSKLVKPSKLRLRRIRELIAEIKRVYPHHVLDIIFDAYMPYSQFLSKTVVGFDNKANPYKFRHMYNNNQNKQHGIHVENNEPTHTSNKNTRKSNREVKWHPRRGVSFKNTANVKEIQRRTRYDPEYYEPNEINTTPASQLPTKDNGSNANVYKKGPYMAGRGPQRKRITNVGIPATFETTNLPGNNAPYVPLTPFELPEDFTDFEVRQALTSEKQKMPDHGKPKLMTNQVRKAKERRK